MLCLLCLPPIREWWRLEPASFQVDSKAREIGLLLKPSKCVSLLFDDSKLLSDGISLLGTKLIMESPTKFLGKLIGVSVHSTKIAAMIDRFTILLKVDQTYL